VTETYRETELKFSVAADWRLPDLRTADLPTMSPVRRSVLTATYYDTHDFRLARAAITLRRRTGGTDAGWHLKLPTDREHPQTRDEVRLPLRAASGERPPRELTDLVMAVVRDAPVTARAMVRTRRGRVLLCTADGREVIEIADDRVMFEGGPLDGFAYREVEIEALTPDAPLGRVADHLSLTGATAGGGSKGIRAIVGDVELAPLVPEPPRTQPDAPAHVAVSHLLCLQVAALVLQDQRIRRNLPDSVHQFRVAARRLRSGLQAFAPLIDQEWAKLVRAELGWIAGAMGAARDREVLEARLVAGLRALSPSIDRAAGLVVVQDTLDADRQAAAALGRDALMSPRYRTLLDTLMAAAADPPTTRRAKRPAAQVLPQLVNARWTTLDKAACRLAGELDGHDDHWHETRIDAKKARYTVEAVTPVFGAPAKAFAQQLARVTDLLGRHQDCAIAADTVAGMLDRDTGPRAAFALGALYEQQRAELRSVRREFLALWPEIEQPRWRRWLRAQR
jgi:CHAD domain-containing protein